MFFVEKKWWLLQKFILIMQKNEYRYTVTETRNKGRKHYVDLKSVEIVSSGFSIT
jgi:hypothetical protein